MKVQQVPLEWVNVTWPMVVPHFARAIQHSRDGYTLDHIQVMVTTGQWALLVVTEDATVCGALAVLFANHPVDRVAFIMAFGGKNVLTPDTLQQFRALVAANGATAIEGAVRGSVGRLLTRYGFKEKARLVKLKI